MKNFGKTLGATLVATGISASALAAEKFVAPAPKVIERGSPEFRQLCADTQNRSGSIIDGRDECLISLDGGKTQQWVAAGIIVALLAAGGVGSFIFYRSRQSRGAPRDTQQQILHDIEDHQPPEIIAAKNELVPWLIKEFPGEKLTFNKNMDKTGGISIRFGPWENIILIQLIKHEDTIDYFLFRNEVGYGGGGSWNNDDQATRISLGELQNELSRIKNPTPPARREPARPTGLRRVPESGNKLNSRGSLPPILAVPDGSSNLELDSAIEGTGSHPEFREIEHTDNFAESLKNADTELTALIDKEFPGVRVNSRVTQSGGRGLNFSYGEKTIEIRLEKGNILSEPYFSLVIGTDRAEFFDTIDALTEKLRKFKDSVGAAIKSVEIPSPHIRRIELAVEFIEIGDTEGGQDLLTEVLEKVDTNTLSPTYRERILTLLGSLIGNERVKANDALSQTCQDLIDRISTVDTNAVQDGVETSKEGGGVPSPVGTAGGSDTSGDEGTPAEGDTLEDNGGGSPDGKTGATSQLEPKMTQASGKPYMHGVGNIDMAIDFEQEELQRFTSTIDSIQTEGDRVVARFSNILELLLPGVSVKRAIEGREYTIAIAPLPEIWITVDGTRYESREAYMTSMKASITNSIEKIENSRHHSFQVLNTLFFQKFDTTLQDIATTITQIQEQWNGTLGVLRDQLGKIGSGESSLVYMEGQPYTISRGKHTISINGQSYADDAAYFSARKQLEQNKIHTLEMRKSKVASMKLQFEEAYRWGVTTENRHDFTISGKKFVTVRKDDGSIHVTTWDDNGRPTTKILATWMQFISEGIITL